MSLGPTETPRDNCKYLKRGTHSRARLKESDRLSFQPFVNHDDDVPVAVVRVIEARGIDENDPRFMFFVIQQSKCGKIFGDRFELIPSALPALSSESIDNLGLESPT